MHTGQIYRCNRTGRNDGCTTWLWCHSEKPQQAGEMGQPGPHEDTEGKHRAMHTGRNSSTHQHVLGSKQLENSLEKKDLWVLWTTKLTMSQWCTLVANQAVGFPSCSGQNVSSRSREEILPLCSAVGTPLECCAQLCASQNKTHIDVDTGGNPAKGH